MTEPATWRADDLAAALEPALPGRVEVDAPLAGLTTYRVGGPAAVLVRARREGDLSAVANALNRARPPLLVVGRGSNLLVADGGFPGLVLVLEGEFEEIETDPGRVRAGARSGSRCSRAASPRPGSPGSSSTSASPGRSAARCA